MDAARPNPAPSADRSLLTASLAGDHDRVQAGAQLTQPRRVAGAGCRAVFDPETPRERDDAADVGELVGLVGRPAERTAACVDQVNALGKGFKLIGT